MPQLYRFNNSSVYKRSSGYALAFLLAFLFALTNSSAQTVTRIQNIEANGDPASASFGSAPVEGNLLIAITGMRVGNDPPPPNTALINGQNVAVGFTTIDGWTKIVENHFKTNGSTADRRGIAIFYKIAGAAEPTGVQTSWNVGGVNNLIIQEFEVTGGCGGNFVFDQAVSNNSGNSSVTSLSTSTTGVSAQDLSLLVTGLVTRDNPGAASWTNGVASNINYTPNNISLQSAFGLHLAQSTKQSTASWSTSRIATAALAVFSVNVFQAPTVSNAGTNQTVCGTATTLNGNAPTIGTGQWSFAPGGNPDALGAIADINSRVSGFTGTAGQAYILRWTISNGVCPTSASDVTIQLVQPPTASNAGANQEQCNNGSFTMAGNNPLTGLGQWSIVPPANGAVITLGEENLPNATVTGLNAGFSVTLRWTITNGVCPSSISNTVLTNRLGPVVNAGSDSETCQGVSFNFSTQITPATSNNFSSLLWTHTGTGTIFNANTLTPTYLPGTGETGVVTFTLTATGNGSCTAVNDVMTLTITPAATANAGSDAEVCEGLSYNFSTQTTLASASNFSTLLWTHTGTGTISNETTLTPSYAPGVGETGAVTFTLTATGNGSCPTVNDQMILNITPAPVVDAGSNAETCHGVSFNFSTQITPATSNNFSSLLWTHTGTGTIFNANTLTPTYLPGTGETGVVTFTLTATGSGSCTAVNDVMALTITPAATANAGSDAEVCEGLSYNFSTQTTLASASNFSTLLWTHTGTGTISNETTLTPSYAPGVGETGAVTFTLTATGNGSCPTVIDQMILNITPAPMVNAGSDAEICQGSTFSFTSQIILASASNYNSIAWTHNGSGTLFNGNTLSPTYFASTSETGIITFTLTTTGNGSCVGGNDQMDLMITPAPIVNAGSDAEVCEGTPTFDFSSRTITASTLNGSGVWSHNGSGSLDNPALLNPVYTLAAGDFGNTITFTLIVSSTSIVCTDVQDTYTLKVNRQALVSVPSTSINICEPARINLSGTVGGSATSGSWSLIAGGGTLSVSSLTGLTVTATYDSVSSDVNSTLTFRLSSNDPDGTGPCGIEYIDVDYVVERAARVFAGADFEVCEYEDITLNGSFGGSASSVSWMGGAGTYSTQNLSSTDYFLTAGEKADNGLVLTFTLTTDTPVGVCPSVFDQVNVTVNDTLSSVVFTPVLGPVYAENDPPVDLTFAGSPVGGVFSGPGVAGNLFFPSIANITPMPPNVITYSFTDGAGCISAPTKLVIVNPITVVNFTVQNENPDPLGLASGYICGNQGDLTLIENPLIPDIPGLITPENAIFSSADLPIAAIFFDPASNKYKVNTNIVAPGIYTITYTYTNSLGASNPVSRLLRFTASPTAIITGTNTCVTTGAVLLGSSPPMIPNPYGAFVTDWLWEFNDGTENTNISQNPPPYVFPGAGTYNVKLTVSTNEGCTGEDIEPIIVGPEPDVNFVWSSFCFGEETKFQDKSTGTIAQYTWDFGDGYTLMGPAGGSVPGGTNGGNTSGTYTNPKHKYAVEGQKDVRLTVQTDVGCIEFLNINPVTILPFSIPTPITSYQEDFEGVSTWFPLIANQGAIPITSNTSWVFGTPSGDVINSASSGVNAWWTGSNPNFDVNLDKSTYYNNEKSAVVSPCFSLESITRPMISIDYWSDSENPFDGAVVQYSTNGGVDWVALGDDGGAGINWYNGRALNGNPGTQPIGTFGWTNRQEEGWKTARYNLDQIIDRDTVVFRVAFGSNNDNGAPPPVNGISDLPFNGFAFDNIIIGDKQRNVLVEYFTNAGISPQTNDYLNNLYQGQILAKGVSDFYKIQYHIANPITDPINQENPFDPAARSLLYGVSQPPSGIMDGILGDYFGTAFNGDQTKITNQQIDRRALEDPLFSIVIVQNPTQTDSINLTVDFEYIDLNPFTGPVTFQVGMVEGNLNGNINVLRKMLLGSEGVTINTTWTNGTLQTIPVKSIIDIPIQNGNDIWLVAFAQDRTTKRIHQMMLVQSVPKTSATIVGIEDDPVRAKVKEIIVYPNPASKVLNFAIESEFNTPVKLEGYSWTMVDQRGVVVLKGLLNEDLSTPQQVEIDKVANGMYIVLIHQADKTFVYRKVAVMNQH